MYVLYCMYLLQVHRKGTTASSRPSNFVCACQRSQHLRAEFFKKNTVHFLSLGKSEECACIYVGLLIFDCTLYNK